MVNRMNSSNAGSNALTSNVDPLQRGNNAKPKHSRKGEKNVVSIIDLLTQTSTLEKEKGKDDP